MSHLVQAGRLLGIADGAVRTSLSRMVAHGELSTSDGVYELSGKLADRRHDIDGAVRPRPPDINWDGTWEMAVVRAGSRSAVQRHALRGGARGQGWSAAPNTHRAARQDGGEWQPPGARAVARRSATRLG
ncbi:MAG: hypothetical protein P8L16_12075, partial [Ilumatobacter sp.]|nr:hypothetical protein [Ilumatobacter sp.]